VRKPVVLVVLDGWGLNPAKEGNGIALARTPVIDTLLAEYPSSTLKASGEEVGLPDGQMGNSEVGHLNLGAGRVVYQDFTRISRAIRDGSFFENEVLLRAMEKAQADDAHLHLMGLVSDGGVHSHIEHLFALLDLAVKKGVRKVCIHALLDGRDVGPHSAPQYISALEDKVKKVGLGQIATIMGRYYGMDRDQRWDRIEKAYQALVMGKGRKVKNSTKALSEAARHKENDEFVSPTVVGNYAGIDPKDTFIFFNFRADRARQITRALTEENFKEFKRKKAPLPYFVCLTEYDTTFKLPVAFVPQKGGLKNVLAQVLSEHNLRQLHLAETEKYAHVTFFFNGGEEKPFWGEDRSLVPSPKVATYDLKPEMSAAKIADRATEQIRSGKYDFIVINFANTDMVGHTGIMKAVIKAVEVVDECVGRVVEAVKEAGGAVLVTADHGNAEKIVIPSGIHTAHTCSDVFFILVSNSVNVKLRSGLLADVAPTVLELLEIEKPRDMTGRSLIS
jgi:2,3-bisphosphoglycerate-independent phosphoglycerate mutase